MKAIKLSIAAAMLTSSALMADFLSDIDTSANVALTSNYVWRGMTQNDDEMAIQGGFDLGYKGVYTGVWASNVDFGDDYDTSIEVDLYAGYANNIGAFSYDLGYCQYTYPGESDELNFGEASLTLGYDFEVVALSAKYYQGIDTGDASHPESGYEFGASAPLPWEITADATFGVYGKDRSQNDDQNPFGNYYSVGLTKSFDKFDINVAYTGMNFDESHAGNDGDGSEDNLVVTLSASF
jgi:uncharacterized protein (TIGR02001 family)